MRVVLISTYDLGHQPFGLASPAAWLEAEGAHVVCNDLSVKSLDEEAIRAASLIGIYVPMHTATRLAGELLPRLRALNERAHYAAFGLYAPVNADYLRRLGVATVIGGEFEAQLTDVYRNLVDSRSVESDPSPVQLDKLAFRKPNRGALPALANYAKLQGPGDRQRATGYTEASRGCKHLCRHCPVVPVYGGAFRVVQRDVVIDDVAQQIAAGAEHITFGDPDFLNGPRHALAVVEELHRRFPFITYDATIKVEHLLKHASLLPRLAETGCLFVTTAVEALDDAVLRILDKGHTRSDFLEALALARASGLSLSPTFVPFTPWTSLDGYAALLHDIAEQRLVDHVAPVQLAIQLLVPQGSLLLDHPAMAASLGGFDSDALSYRWTHPDRRVDALQREIQFLVERASGSNRDVFSAIWSVTHDALGASRALPDLGRPVAVVRTSEPWYCCAEPTELQRAAI